MSTIRRVLIDLDCLLDTRLGIIHQLCPEAALDIAQSDHYWLRDYTDWEELTHGRVTNEEFKEAWLNRDNDVILNSMMTSIFLPLESTLANHRINKEEGISEYDIALVINEWPYVLGDEVKETIKEAIKFHLSGSPSVIFTRTTLDDLTPVHIVDNYHHVYMFDFLRWIKRHGFGLEKIHAPGLTVVVPRLFDINPRELDTEAKKKEIFLFQMVTRYYFEVQFIEAEYFSMFRPSVVERLDKSMKQDDNGINSSP